MRPKHSGMRPIKSIGKMEGGARRFAPGRLWICGRCACGAPTQPSPICPQPSATTEKTKERQLPTGNIPSGGNTAAKIVDAGQSAKPVDNARRRIVFQLKSVRATVQPDRNLARSRSSAVDWYRPDHGCIFFACSTRFFADPGRRCVCRRSFGGRRLADPERRLCDSLRASRESGVHRSSAQAIAGRGESEAENSRPRC